jgi:hypothetical protein
LGATQWIRSKRSSQLSMPGGRKSRQVAKSMTVRGLVQKSMKTAGNAASVRDAPRLLAALQVVCSSSLLFARLGLSNSILGPASTEKARRARVVTWEIRSIRASAKFGSFETLEDPERTVENRAGARETKHKPISDEPKRLSQLLVHRTSRRRNS